MITILNIKNSNNDNSVSSVNNSKLLPILWEYKLIMWEQLALRWLWMMQKNENKKKLVIWCKGKAKWRINLHEFCKYVYPGYIQASYSIEEHAVKPYVTQKGMQ